MTATQDTKRTLEEEENPMLEKRLRLMETNLDLCLNYAREMAKAHLLPEQIAEIENKHLENLAAINQDGE